MSAGSRLRFVSWAAVSSLPQAKKISNEDQLRVNAEYVARHGGQVVEELVVPGESRSIILLEEACRRIPAYARLVQLIEDRSFDVLVYLDRSRLGRKASLSMAIVELCHAAGIAICETESGGELIYGATYDQLLVGAIKSVAAQQEINKLTERHRMGMLARVQRGDWPNNLPYGYKYVYSVDGQRSVVVDESAKEVIRRIFDLYLSGLGISAIIARLNDEGAPSPHQRRWANSTVAGIIERPWRYAGYIEYNRASKVGRPLVRFPSRSEAIISEETAQAAEEATARRLSGRLRPDAHAFSGIVWCAKCSRRMQRVGEKLISGEIVWRCRRGHTQASVYEGVLRTTLKTAIERLAAHLTDEVVDYITDNAENELHKEKTSTKKAIDECYARIERLDEAFAAGVMDLDRFAKQVKAVQSRLDSLTERMQALQAQQVLLGNPSDRLRRRQELIDRGLGVLHENTPEANAFLRARVRLWCAERRVVRVEFI